MIPRAMMPHRMTVQDYAGSDATGHLYGDPRRLRCYVEAKTRSVRTPDGRDVVASSVIRCDLDRTIKSESRITVFGRRAEIIAVIHFEFPGTPSHTEVMIQ